MHERFPFMLDLNDLKRSDVKKACIVYESIETYVWVWLRNNSHMCACEGL